MSETQTPEPEQSIDATGYWRLLPIQRVAVDRWLRDNFGPPETLRATAARIQGADVVITRLDPECKEYEDVYPGAAAAGWPL